LNTDASHAVPGWAVEIHLRLEPAAAAASVQVLALLTAHSKQGPCPTPALLLPQQGASTAQLGHKLGLPWLQLLGTTLR